MSETFEKIRDIVVDLLGVEPEEVKPESRFREDLEADSLDLVELIMEFEEAFGGTITDEEARGIRTVQEAVEYIEHRLASAA